jgi:DNA-binding NtrC family response regulator
MHRLLSYRWPGNVRELQNVLKRYVTLGRLALADAPPQFAESLPRPDGAAGPETVPDLQAGILADEKKVISLALRRNHWQRSKTSASLGINRRTLIKK